MTHLLEVHQLLEQPALPSRLILSPKLRGVHGHVHERRGLGERTECSLEVPFTFPGRRDAHLVPGGGEKAGGGSSTDLLSRLLRIGLNVCYGVALVRRSILHCWGLGSVVA